MRLDADTLQLHALDHSLARLLVQNDEAAAREALNATFPQPFHLPPLLDEDIAAFRDALEQHPDARGWWGWLVIDRARNHVVGFVICTAPDGDGVSIIGWSTYPESQRRGYATRAARAVIDWALSTGLPRIVRATVPPALCASIAVAKRLGMRRVATESRPEGEVQIYELTR